MFYRCFQPRLGTSGEAALIDQDNVFKEIYYQLQGKKGVNTCGELEERFKIKEITVGQHLSTGSPKPQILLPLAEKL